MDILICYNLRNGMEIWPHLLIEIDPILATSMQSTHKAILDILICYNLRNGMEGWPHFTYRG